MLRTKSLVLALLLSATAVGCDDTMSDSLSYADGRPQNAGRAYPTVDAPAAPLPGETYAAPAENDFIDATKERMSTFAVDVDTASYSLMRRDIKAGRLPNQEGVRPEEYVNYFKYAYPQPTDQHPFSVNIDAAPSKFGENLHLLRIGLQGRTIDAAQRKPANLVFLVDVSGSMQGPDRLDLVKYTLKKLTDQLKPTDTLSIVTYAGVAATLLEPTAVTDKQKITSAIDALVAGGGTNGEGGIRRAYDLAERTKTQDTESRVVLCTDGDFNVGVTGDELVKLVEGERDKGVTLTTLGFGSGNYDDAQMESLADKGNGNYAYVDSEHEADKVVGIRLTSTIQVIAKDVKVQIELDPTLIARYRLVGYENRVLGNEDFKDDAKDAGEIGAGHSVTAFYEVELTAAAKSGQAQGDLAKVKLRYKQPLAGATDPASELEKGFAASAISPTFEAAAPDFRFAASVTELSEILRHSKHSTGARFDDVIAIAQGASNQDADRLELVHLAQNAKALWK